MAWRAASLTRGMVRLFLNGVESGHRVRVVGPLHLDNMGTMSIGDDVSISSGPWANPVGGSNPTSIVVRRGARLTIGDRVGISNAEIYCRTEISIGDGTLIGGGARIYDTDFHPILPEDRNPDRPEMVRSRPVRIGRRVFIGAHAIIMKGVSIGDGAVVGAGAVVLHDVPPREVWAGNPARLVKALPGEAASRPGLT